MIVYLDDGLAQSSIGSVVTWRYSIPGYINQSITQDINKTINTRFQSITQDTTQLHKISINQLDAFIHRIEKKLYKSNLSASLQKNLINLT